MQMILLSCSFLPAIMTVTKPWNIHVPHDVTPYTFIYSSKPIFKQEIKLWKGSGKSCQLLGSVKFSEGTRRYWFSTLCTWLVSTYVVCERLSVMHEPAGVVENLVQILQNTPILKYRIPPPPKWKLSEILALWLFSFRIPPPPPNWNLGRSWHFVTFQFQNTPPPPENWNLGRSWHFVTFQFQNTPPQKLKFENLVQILQNTPIPKYRIPPSPKIEI